MAFDDLQLCNMALSNLGSSRQLSALAEQGKEAAMCRTWLEVTKDQVFASFPWPFASVYQSIGLVAEEPNTDWGYSYRYPPDCMRLIRITGNGRALTGPEYQVSSDASGLLLLTDESEVTVYYVKRISAPGFWPIEFANAVAWLLSFNLASPLTTTAGKKAECWNGYLTAIGQAQALSINETQMDPQPESDLITVRG